MSGNKMVLIIIVLFCFVGISLAEKRIPAKSFRIGLNLEAGVKSIGPFNFHGKAGIIIKLNEKFCFIPYIGPYPDEVEKDYYEYYYYYYVRNHSVTHKETVIDAGLTIRFEFPREIIKRSTAFEYDRVEQKFLHHHYYSAFRPFFQLHLGTFLGAGTGFLYYFNGAISLGINLDVGYNLLAEKGFGVSPKLVISTAF